MPRCSRPCSKLPCLVVLRTKLRARAGSQREDFPNSVRRGVLAFQQRTSLERSTSPIWVKSRPLAASQDLVAEDRLQKFDSTINLIVRWLVATRRTTYLTIGSVISNVEP